MFELLNRVKDKIFNTLGGAGQAVGNFAQQNIQRSQPVQTFNNLRQAAPQIQQQVQRVLPPVQETIGNFWEDQMNRPAVPSLEALFPKQPTTGDALNFAADVTYRLPARVGAEAALNITNQPNRTPQPGIEQFLLGNEPIKRYDDPNRWASTIGNATNIPAPLLIGAGIATDLVPDPSDVAKGVGKKVFKETGEKVVKNLPRNAPKLTEELFKTGIPGSPLTSGNNYKPKGTTKKLFEDTFRSSQGVIERSGPAGAEISRLLNAADKQKDFASGFAKNKLKTALNGLETDELDTFADVVQGYAKPVSERQKQAVDAWNQISADVAKQAKKSGLDMNIRENYFPHMTLELSNADKRVIAQEMVDGGKAKTVAEALQDLENQSGSLGSQAQRRYGNLELPRETDLPYNRSPNVLMDYVEGAYGRIADAKHFGKDDSYLYELARAAGTQGGDANQVTKYLDQILGKNQQGNWSKKLTSLQTITKLSPVTSAINLTQNLSTWLRTDTGTMLKTMKNVITNPKGAYANARRVGEITDDMSKELQDVAGTGNAAAGWIRLIGMQGTEKFNRVMAVNAGMEYGKKLAKQAANGSGAALRELDRLGIKPSQIKNGELTEEGLKTIGREVSKTTQFATGAGELPYFWRTNVGKVATQFKSFAFKQTGFMKDEAKRGASEFAKGNVKPLINALAVFGIAAPIAGEIVNDWKSIMRNKKREDVDSLTERYLSNIAAASSFGLLDSTSALFGEFGPQGTISTIGGPTAGDIAKTAVAGYDASEGIKNYDPEKSLDENLDPKNTTKRNLVKAIPGVGQTLSNTFIPNAGIDNYIGVNNSLAKDDNAKYKELLATDPEAAAEFKKSNKWSPDSKKEKDSKVAGALAGDEFVYTTDAGKKRTISLVEKDLSGKTGVDAYDKDAGSPGSKAVEIWGSNAPEKQKLEAYKKLGVEPDDVRYAYKTRGSFTNDERTSYIRDQKLEHDELVERLITGRVESITGRFFATEGVLNNLADEGLITKAEAKWLKNMKLDKDGKLLTPGSAGGSGGTGGSGGISASKIKSAIKSLNSLFKESSKPEKAISVKAPKAPELKFSKIAKSSVKRRTKDSKRWFDA